MNQLRLPRLSNRQKLVLSLAVIVGVTTVGIYVYTHPSRVPIPYGFTWIGPATTKGGQDTGITITDQNLRLLYVQHITIVQNIDKKDDPPSMFTGGFWYFRGLPDQQLTVYIVDPTGQTVIQKVPGVWTASNDPRFCDPKKVNGCGAYGAVYILVPGMDGKLAWNLVMPGDKQTIMVQH